MICKRKAESETDIFEKWQGESKRFVRGTQIERKKPVRESN